MRNTIFSFFFLLSFTLLGQIPDGYYNTATGTGYTLKTQLYNIIKGHTDKGYNWTFFNANDRDYYYENDGKILDIYSENPNGADPYNYTVATDQCSGTYGGEGDCYNREHTVPQSWFNEGYPMKSDVHHLFASDGYVNGRRGNYPFGEVGSATWTSQNGSKLGSARSGLGYSGTVFEPINEFKGDLARVYFYMATRYQNVIASWEGNSTADPVLNGTSDQVYENWVVAMLLTWHANDPVSQKEIDRNNAAYTYQGNRNPFVDHPEYVNAIWGTGTATPTIMTTATAGGYNFGNVVAGNSSSSVNYKVAGSNLTGNVTVTVTAPFQVSLNNSTWSTSVTVTEANAEANTNNTVYVRFSPTVANGQTYNSNITHTATGAPSVNVAVSGKEGAAGAPFIAFNTANFNNDFGQSTVNDISSFTSYSVSASNLTANLTITAPEHFQISLAPTSGYAGSLQLTQAGGIVASTLIYVIFYPSESGDLSGLITHTSGTASENLAVQGFGMVATSTGFKPSDIKIYPNPANDLLTLEGIDVRRANIRLFDSYGTRQNVVLKDGALDVSELVTGVYYLTIETQERRSVAKVVISR